MPRPRGPRRVRFTHPGDRATNRNVRRGQTADLYLNTSLEDDETRMNDLLGPRLPTCEELYEMGLAMEEESRLAAAEEEIRREHTIAQRIEQLQGMRAQLASHADRLVASFNAEMNVWKAVQPERHAKFEVHMRAAELATTGSARRVDMLRWFPGLAPMVRIAIEDMQTYAHKDAELLYHIACFEEKLEGAMPRHGLDAETYLTAHRDRAKTKGDGIPYEIFGFNLKHPDLAKFQENQLENEFQGREIPRLQAILGNFMVRRTLLEATGFQARHDDGRRPRYHEYSINKFCHTANWDMIAWSVDALALLAQLRPEYKQHADASVPQLLESTIHTIAEYARKIDTVGYFDLKRQIALDYTPRLPSLRQHLAQLRRDGADVAGRNRLYEMQEKVWAMSRDFDKFEKDHGDLLGPEWRQLQREYIDDITSVAPPVLWTDEDDEEYLRRSGHPDEGWPESEDEAEAEVNDAIMDAAIVD
ncbi:hypothetical protein CKM354_001291500 [Cercospora kikuchii]|uniref:Uncharacterized protein n=1 Tax=Cercospora kikuchii TaxID=84275 RepID=A0A9P3FMW4_9PEZI|nr:uncharacterized protein CKM354_001291500 [Cercospora kikuchii]GIZ49898.1 hypothetical protein CKM354_001291500 [Cercospora kikuchii]